MAPTLGGKGILSRCEVRGERREERGERIEKSVLIRVICAKKTLCLRVSVVRK